MINGVDVSDPTRAFTDDEWNRLSYNGGQQYVYQARDRMAGRGRGGRGNCDGGRGRSVGAVDSASNETVNSEGTTADSSNSGNGDRGARNGRGFGRGAYQRS
jgi:hypothetical protein